MNEEISGNLEKVDVCIACEKAKANLGWSGAIDIPEEDRNYVLCPRCDPKYTAIQEGIII